MLLKTVYDCAWLVALSCVSLEAALQICELEISDQLPCNYNPASLGSSKRGRQRIRTWPFRCESGQVHMLEWERLSCLYQLCWEVGGRPGGDQASFLRTPSLLPSDMTSSFLVTSQFPRWVICQSPALLAGVGVGTTPGSLLLELGSGKSTGDGRLAFRIVCPLYSLPQPVFEDPLASQLRP